jgi:hypothetical protein
MQFSLSPSLSLQSKQTKYQSAMKAFCQRILFVKDGSIEHVILMFSEVSHFGIIRIWIPNSIAILKFNLFKNCRKLPLISFESNSRLTRTESNSFSSSSLESILIPRNVEILDSSCFSNCYSLSSISFESNSRLTRIESSAFSSSLLQSILIPGTVEILGSSCFWNCHSFSAISFESNSRLTQIESFAFSYSSLQSIIISHNVQFIDGSALIDVSLSSISVESGNIYFVVANDLLIDVVHHKLIRNFSSSSNVEIGSDVEIVGSSCFSNCHSLSSISFESNSRLTRIESNAFSS